MRAVSRFALVFAFATVLPGAWAADLSGAWKGAFDFQGTTIPVTLNLKSDGKTVSGTVEGLPTTPTDIHDGALTGDTLTFWVNTDYQGQTYKLIYKGKVSAGQIVFDFGTEDGTFTAPLTVTKGVPPAPPAPVDVGGDWKGAFDLNGTQMPVTLHLKNAAGAVTGTIDGLGPAPTEIHEGKLDGATVTFWVNADYQGQTYTLVYKGKIAPGQIDFDFGTADQSWGATITVKKT
ncbi:MAG TPA: hypothetical protein VGG85_03265 [Terracidiphilus sp.]|jgi:hypothetical protein